MTSPNNPNEISRAAWEAQIGCEGNDFFRLLCWSVLSELLSV